MDKVCFWSVGDGIYAELVQSLVNSFHAVGMEGDFHVFSDRKIDGAITHRVKSFDKRGCYFKFNFLQQLKDLDYHIFIYLDADTLFLKKPPLMLKDLLHEDPLHLFLESDCTVPQPLGQNWWGCPLEEYVRMMRECGVSTPHIYNLNGGFVIVKKHAIDIVCELAFDFAKYAKEQRYHVPDELAWAYAMHLLSKNLELHLLSHYWDVWCADWEGVFEKRLPDGKPWTFNEYMSYAPHLVNPAIVHLVKSKDLLRKRSLI